MQITLPPEAQAVVDRAVAEGRFTSEEDAIVTAILLLEDGADHDVTYIPDEYFVEARAQVARGKGVPLTEELRKQIRERARLAHERGEPISEDVVY